MMHQKPHDSDVRIDFRICRRPPVALSYLLTKLKTFFLSYEEYVSKQLSSHTYSRPIFTPSALAGSPQRNRPVSLA